MRSCCRPKSAHVRCGSPAGNSTPARKLGVASARPIEYFDDSRQPGSTFPFAQLDLVAAAHVRPSRNGNRHGSTSGIGSRCRTSMSCAFDRSGSGQHPVVCRVGDATVAHGSGRRPASRSSSGPHDSRLRSVRRAASDLDVLNVENRASSMASVVLPLPLGPVMAMRSSLVNPRDRRRCPAVRTAASARRRRR